MRKNIEIVELDAAEIHDGLPAKVFFISDDTAWLRRQEAALRAVHVTSELFVEEYKDAILSPVRRSQSRNRHAGGVFDQQKRPIRLGRIMHRDEVVFGNEAYDNEEACEAEVDEALWAGVLTKHFGHFITEGIARLHAAWDNDMPIIYSAKYSPRPRATLFPWMVDVFRGLGIDPGRIIFAEKATRVRRLVVPNAGLELGRSFSTQFIEGLRSRVAKVLSLPPDRHQDGQARLFLSRSNLPQGRHAIGEVPLQAELLRKGWRITHPEAVNFNDQMSTLASADIVAGTYGSQMHTILFRPNRKPLNALFLATSYFNGTYVHADLQTPGLKVIAKCDDYGGFSPFGNKTPYVIDRQIAQLGFAIIGEALEIPPSDATEYPVAWLKALFRSRQNQEISEDRFDRMLSSAPPQWQDHLRLHRTPLNM